MGGAVQASSDSAAWRNPGTYYLRACLTCVFLPSIHEPQNAARQPIRCAHRHRRPVHARNSRTDNLRADSECLPEVREAKARTCLWSPLKIGFARRRILFGRASMVEGFEPTLWPARQKDRPRLFFFPVNLSFDFRGQATLACEVPLQDVVGVWIRVTFSPAFVIEDAYILVLLENMPGFVRGSKFKPPKTQLPAQPDLADLWPLRGITAVNVIPIWNPRKLRMDMIGIQLRNVAKSASRHSWQRRLNPNHIGRRNA